MAYSPRELRFKIGDRVCCIDDPRHVGRVEAVFATRLLKVRWLDTGWISEIEIDDLEHSTD